MSADFAFTVPVEIEVPPEAVSACRRGYENRKAAGAEPQFADFLMDLVTFDPTFTVNGREIDPATGHCEVNANE